MKHLQRLVGKRTRQIKQRQAMIKESTGHLKSQTQEMRQYPQDALPFVSYMERNSDRLFSPHITWVQKERSFNRFRPLNQTYKVSATLFNST